MLLALVNWDGLMTGIADIPPKKSVLSHLGGYTNHFAASPINDLSYLCFIAAISVG
jgi:hypothetical protein